VPTSYRCCVFAVAQIYQCTCANVIQVLCIRCCTDLPMYLCQRRTGVVYSLLHRSTNVPVPTSYRCCVFAVAQIYQCTCANVVEVLCVCCCTDLASMMMQCSDLSTSAKTARSFAKKSTVNEVQRARPAPTVTYRESHSARQWSADQSDSLTELFTLPGKHFITAMHRVVALCACSRISAV